MADVIVNGADVYRYDDGSGVWRHIPDPDTANAMGVDWNGLDPVDSVPEPTGDDWPSIGTPATAPVPGISTPQLPTGITAGDYGGASDISTLSQTTAGQQILTDAGITPQDVPQLPPSGYDPNYHPSSLGVPGYDDDDDPDTIRLLVLDIFQGDNAGGVRLAEQSGGNLTAQGTWRSLLNTFAHQIPEQCQAAKASARRFIQKVG